MKWMAPKLFLCMVTLSLIVGCDESDLGINDCFSIGLLLDVSHTTDGLTASFEINYDGSNTLNDEVRWDFGDGTSQTTTGRSAEHTYSASGSYDVKATVTLSGPDIGDCPKEINEMVIL